MCHFGSVGSGYIALEACGCGSNNQKITIAVGESKQLSVTVSVCLKTRGTMNQ